MQDLGEEFDVLSSKVSNRECVHSDWCYPEALRLYQPFFCSFFLFLIYLSLLCIGASHTTLSSKGGCLLDPSPPRSFPSYSFFFLAGSWTFSHPLTFLMFLPKKPQFACAQGLAFSTKRFFIKVGIITGYI